MFQHFQVSSLLLSISKDLQKMPRQASRLANRVVQWVDSSLASYRLSSVSSGIPCSESILLLQIIFRLNWRTLQWVDFSHASHKSSSVSTSMLCSELILLMHLTDYLPSHLAYCAVSWFYSCISQIIFLLNWLTVQWVNSTHASHKSSSVSIG